VRMAFVGHITGSIPAVRLIENDIPWKSLVDMHNDMDLHYDGPVERIEDKPSRFLKRLRGLQSTRFRQG